MTATEWLWEQIDGIIPYQDINTSQLFIGLLEQAKEMEKQQIIDAYEQGSDDEIVAYDGTRKYKHGVEYYNETYGSKGSDELHEDNLEEIISEAHNNITRRKGKDYAPTSSEIQAEIEKSEKPINLLSNQKDIFYSHNDVLEMMKKFHTYEMNIELNMLKLTPLKITSSQTEISDEEIKKEASRIHGVVSMFFVEGAKWYREQLKKKQ